MAFKGRSKGVRGPQPFYLSPDDVLFHQGLISDQIVYVRDAGDATYAADGGSEKSAFVDDHIRYRSRLMYIASWKLWQVLAVGGLVAVTLIVLAMYFIQDSRSRYVPFVMAVDDHGVAITSGIARPIERVSDKIVVAELSQFIMDVRTVSMDASLMTQNIYRAYDHVEQSSAAFGFLNEYFAGAKPFERAAEETVTIEVKSVLKLSEGTYQVDWIESARERKSGKRTRAAEGWRAIITYRQGGLKSEIGEVIRNPAGVYVSDISWQKVGGS